MKLYTNDQHEIIGYEPNYIPADYANEYEAEDGLLSGKSYTVACGYKYEPQYELDFNEDGSMKYDDQGNLIYKLDDEGQKIFVGYGFFPFIDTQVLARFQQEADERAAELGAVRQENTMLRTAATFAAVSFTDSQALAVKELYPDWGDLPEGTHLETGQRVQYQERLHKVTTTHEKQATWTPTDAPTLYETIDEAHTGTLDDPIPAAPNMEYYEGKYYSEGGTVYRCIRGTGIPIAQLPSTLVGICFEKVEQ